MHGVGGLLAETLYVMGDGDRRCERACGDEVAKVQAGNKTS